MSATAPLLLAPALLLAAPDTAHLAGRALTAANGTRLEVVSTTLAPSSGCAFSHAEPAAAPERSTVVPVKLVGTDARGGRCHSLAWIRVRVLTPALVLAHAVKQGEPLAGAVLLTLREPTGETPLSALDDGAVAAWALAKGTALERRHVRAPGPGAGDRVQVHVLGNGFCLVQEAVAVGCPGGLCARLHNGRRVGGRWHDGRLEVTP